MRTIGTVRTWDAERGWGVIDSNATPGGCWAHFSPLQLPGFTTLEAGDRVVLEWERAAQDGFQFRAVRAWPEGVDPQPSPEASGAAGAFSSELGIEWE